MAIVNPNPLFPHFSLSSALRCSHVESTSANAPPSGVGHAASWAASPQSVLWLLVPVPPQFFPSATFGVGQAAGALGFACGVVAMFGLAASITPVAVN
jgi:hypothetical protein